MSLAASIPARNRSTMRPRPTAREPLTVTTSPGSRKRQQPGSGRIGGGPHAASLRFGQGVEERRHCVADEEDAVDLGRGERPGEFAVEALAAAPSSSMSPSTATRLPPASGERRAEHGERRTHRCRAGIVALVDQGQCAAPPRKFAAAAAPWQRLEPGQRFGSACEDPRQPPRPRRARRASSSTQCRPGTGSAKRKTAPRRAVSTDELPRSK